MEEKYSATQSTHEPVAVASRKGVIINFHRPCAARSASAFRPMCLDSPIENLIVPDNEPSPCVSVRNPRLAIAVVLENVILQEKKFIAAELSSVCPGSVAVGSSVPVVVVNHNAVSILGRPNKSIVIHHTNHCFGDDHSVEVIDLAVIHPELAAVGVTSCNLDDPAEFINGSATILKFNSGDAGKIICNQSDLYQRHSIDSILDDAAPNACAL
jgi:hypothetical protein